VSVARPYRTRNLRPVELEQRRSNAAIPVAVVLVVIGLYLASVSVLLTALLGLVLLVSSGSLLSTRLNPLSPTFYLTKKPSFLAIGVVFLGALILFGGAYYLWVHHLGTLVPRF
jgi:membrane protein implicated in regulation of membrane protease activity